MRGLIAAFCLTVSTPAVAQEATVSIETATDGTRTLAHELVIPASAEDVWQAVATTDGWRTWAVPLAREVPGTDRFETNYDPSAQPGVSSAIEQEWLSREAPHKATFRTMRTPTGFPHSDAYLRVVSTFTLTPEGPAATRVRLRGTGYPSGPDGDALIGFFKAGNSISLRQLHTRFTTGPIDWGARKGPKQGE
jgi:uncharacterized protein YndB with AHSA1/START domain